MDDDDLRKVRTVADELRIVLLLEGDADETFLLVGVKLGIVAYNLSYGDRLETGQLRKSWIIFLRFLK